MTIDRIPDSELEVMQILWNFDPPVPRRVLEDEMKKVHPIAQTTLLTLVSRLVKKHLISADKNGRSSEYTPLISRDEYLASVSETFIRKNCGGKMSVLASALTGSGLSHDDIEELRRLLAEDRL